MSENPGTIVERQRRKVVTSPTHSSLPDRSHDFCAHYDGEEENGGYGYGATPEAAIADFLKNGGHLEAPRISPGFQEALDQLHELGAKPSSKPDFLAKLFAPGSEGGAA